MQSFANKKVQPAIYIGGDFEKCTQLPDQALFGLPF